jgi:hypothetical protein
MLRKLKKTVRDLSLRFSMLSFAGTILSVLVSIWSVNNRTAVKFSSTAWLLGILCIVFTAIFFCCGVDWDREEWDDFSDLYENQEPK